MKSSKVKKTLIKIISLIIILCVSYNLIYIVCSAFDKTTDFSLFGTRFFIINDETMEPNLKQNDIIITKKCKEADIEVKSIIVFNKNNSIKISRIGKINASNVKNYYITKMDNSYYYDAEEIGVEDIQGKLWIKIPKLGIFIKLLQSKIVTAFIIVYILLMFIHNRNMIKKSIERRKKAETRNL